VPQNRGRNLNGADKAYPLVLDLNFEFLGIVEGATK
jgi:hypothetical protein